MADHPSLSENIPRIAPPRMHARKPSRSPTRNRLGDDLLADLSPATTLEAFTSPSGKLKASIEAATPSERAFGLRATLASKKIQEWLAELSDWQWPVEGGSVGFEIPAAKRRKLANEHNTTPNSPQDSAGRINGEARYIGSLLETEVDRYEDRIDEITDEMDDLNVEDIKRQVLDTHFSPKSRPSSSSSNAPPMPSLFASYTRMDDFTAVVTATVLQALPNLSRLMRLLDIWTIRLSILRKVPPLLKALDDAENGLRSGWDTIKRSQTHFDHEQVVSRQTFDIMTEVLQQKVTNLGKNLDFMLDTLEGREDTLPDSWLDRMDLIERDYGEWIVAGDRIVREGEWAIMEKRRKEEEEARRLKEAELARLKLEQERLEAERLRALQEAEEVRLEAIAKEEARVKAEEAALEASRLKNVRDAEIAAEAARIEAEREAQEIAKREAAEKLEMARLQAVREAELAEIARVEAESIARDLARRKAEEERLELARLEALRLAEQARIEAAEREAARIEATRIAEELARKKSEEEALEKSRLEALRQAEILEAARVEAERVEAERLEAANIEAARLEAARIEAARVEAERVEAARLEAARVEAEKVEAARFECERLEKEHQAQELTRRLASEALEATRLEELRIAKIEQLRIKTENEAKQLARQKAEEEELVKAKALEDAQLANAARIETERQALELSKRQAEADALEVIRIQALKDAEATRRKAEFEAQALAARKASEEILEAARLKALRESEEAEAARLKAKREADELARQKSAFEAAELERVRLENEALESARLQALREAEDARVAKIKLEEEAQELVRHKAEFEAAEVKRIKIEEELAQAEGLRIEQAFQESERLRIAHELEETTRQNVDRELKKAQAMEIVRLEALRDAEESRQNAEREANLRRVQAEKQASEVARVQAEKDAVESERTKAREAEEDAHRQAEHDKTNAAKLKVAQDAELPRLEVEAEALELSRSQALKDTEDVEVAQLQIQKELETKKLQAKEDVLKRQTEHDSAFSMLKNDQASESIINELSHDAEHAAILSESTRVQAEQDLVPHFEREVSDAHLPRQDEISDQKASNLVHHLEAVGKDTQGSPKSALQKGLEEPQFLDSSKHASVLPSSDTEDKSISAIKPNSSNRDIDASTSENPSHHTSMGVTSSTVTVGLGMASFAYLQSLTADRIPSSPEHNNDPVSRELQVTHPVYDDFNNDPSHILQQTPSSASVVLENGPGSLQDMIFDSGIDSPIKFDAPEPQTPALGSPIHFDDHFHIRAPSSTKNASPDQSLPIETSQLPGVETKKSSHNFLPTKSVTLDQFPLLEEVDIIPDASQGFQEPEAKSAPITSDLQTSSANRPTYDGATDANESTPRPAGTGWIVISSADVDETQNAEGIVSLQDSGLSDHIFKSPRVDEDNITRMPQNHGNFNPIPIENGAATTEHLPPAPKSVYIPDDTDLNNGSKRARSLTDLPIEVEDTSHFSTPSKPQSLHDDLDEYEDLSSILSPVAEEELMPSIEVDTFDGSCAACDSRSDDEDVPSTRRRKSSVGHFESRIRRSRDDSICSDTSTIINSRLSEVPQSPIPSPQLDGNFLGSFQKEAEQSPSAGRIGHRSKDSFELPLLSPSSTPRLYKQRSLQVLRTPGLFGDIDLESPSTPLEAPTFDNVDVTETPSFSSPRKASSDNQLQQQISSLLETIPARIRLTSDLNSTPFTSQASRPKKARRSVTPSFRPSSSMSNHSTSSRAQTPSFTLAPAFSKTTQHSRGSIGNPEIKLYHLSRSTGEAPIKLFVRLVGEHGERVMVRVGGGWADLGEYLKEYASHHGRRSTLEGGEKIEIQDLPSRVVSGSSISSNTTVRDNGRTTPFGRHSSVPFSRPSSVIGNRPGSSLEVRKTRRSIGTNETAKVQPRLSDIRNEDRTPVTPLPSTNPRSYKTPPSAASITSSSGGGTAASVASGRNSRLSWAEEDSSLGLAGPKAKKIVISERDQEWVESMKEKVKLASAEKERRTRERERLDRERERKTSFGEMDKVGGTKRLFRKSLAERSAAQKGEKSAPS